MEDLEVFKKKIEMSRSGHALRKFNEYTVLSAFRMQSIYSKALHIDSDKVFGTEINIRFLAKISSLKKEFDINEIKLDILNNMPMIDICMKWKEPESVINEIKENMDKEDFIISSKLYTTSEVAKLFGFNNVGSVSNNPVLVELNEARMKKTNNYWIGKKLLDNYKKIARGFNGNKIIELDNIEYLSLVEASSFLGLKTYILTNRVIKGAEVFGVKIDLKRNAIGSGRKVLLLCKLEDLKKAKLNKKYYIEHAEFRESNNIDFLKVREIRKIYIEKYNENFSLEGAYIKKEKLARIVEIANELGYLTKDK